MIFLEMDERTRNYIGSIQVRCKKHGRWYGAYVPGKKYQIDNHELPPEELGLFLVVDAWPIKGGIHLEEIKIKKLELEDNEK